MEIPDSVKSVGDYAFYGCNNLKSVTIPNSVTSIGNKAFYNTGIYNDSLNWVDDVLYIDNCIIAAKTTLSGDYEIMEGVRLIAGGSFWGCNALTSVVIPNSIKSIEGGMFVGCDSLKTVVFPESVINIGGSVFSICI